MRLISKLALAATVLCCSLATSTTQAADLNDFTNAFRDRMSCLQGVALLKGHYNTITSLKAEGWRNLVIDGAVNNPWEIVSNMTWEIMANNVSLRNLGVRPDVMQNSARTLWKIASRDKSRADQTLEILYDKCYSDFKVAQTGRELELDSHDDLLEKYDPSNMGWNSYPRLEQILGYKMDFDGNKLRK